MDPWEIIAAERRAIADQLEGLTAERWTTPSLCAGWTVRDVLAHLVMPHVTSMPKFILVMLRSRMNFDRANQVLTAGQAARPIPDLVADLRRFATGRFTPPGLGVEAPLTDVLVHGQDLRIPLGLPDTAPLDGWVQVLRFAVSPAAQRGLAHFRLPDVGWAATDAEWRHGDGPQVEGPAAALALAMLGRDARTAELTGPGATVVENWLRRGSAA
jgi:uncharacterized protein (TIGR03083 family)